MLFEPHKDNVFLILDPPEKETPGGLYLPDMDKNSKYGPKVLAATVHKVGAGGYGYKNETDDWTNFEMEVDVGERVLVEHLCGEPVVVGIDILSETAPDHPTGTEFRVVRSSEIQAVLD